MDPVAFGSAMEQIVGSSGTSERRKYPLFKGDDKKTYHIVHNHGTIAPGDEHPVGDIHITDAVMRVCVDAKKVVDHMFKTLPLMHMIVKTPFIVPTVLMMEVSELMSVKKLLVILLSITAAYERATGHFRMSTVLDSIFCDVSTDKPDEYTVLVVGVLTHLVIVMLGIPEEGWCTMEMDLGVTPHDLRGPADGPAWVEGMVDFIQDQK